MSVEDSGTSPWRHIARRCGWTLPRISCDFVLLSPWCGAPRPRKQPGDLETPTIFSPTIIAPIPRTRSAYALVSLSQQVDPSQTDACSAIWKLLWTLDSRRPLAYRGPAESLAIGPNLLANPGFEAWPADSDPDGWEPLDASRFEYSGPALFITGAEAMR